MSSHPGARTRPITPTRATPLPRTTPRPGRATPARSALAAALALALGVPAVARGQVAGCIGDRNGDGEVRIDELIVGVNCALGAASPADCQAFDADGRGTVTIDELVRAVNNALGSCAAPVLLDGQEAIIAAARMTVSTVEAVQVLDLGFAGIAGAAAAGSGSQFRLTRQAGAPAAPHGDAIGGGAGAPAPCPRGGTADVDCVVSGERSTRTVVYDRCVATRPEGGTVTRNGTVVQTVGSSAFCQTLTIPPEASVRLELRDFAQIDTSPTGIFLNRRRASISDDFLPLGVGCASNPTGTEVIDGTLRFDCNLAADPACAPGIADVTIRPRDLRIVRTASGSPCEVRLRLDGELGIDNDATGDRFTQRFSAADGGLVLTETALENGSTSIRQDGRTTVECLGSIELRTDPDSAIRLQPGNSCPLAGDVRVALGAGGAAAAPEPAAARAAAGRAGAFSESGGLREHAFRAAGGQVYQVLQNPAGNPELGTEDVRITTVVGSDDAVARCDAQPGARSNAQAVVAAAAGRVFPLAATRKSRLIADASPPCFNPNGEGGDGQLCIGPGCAVDCTCPAGGCETFTAAAGTALAIGTDVPAAALRPGLGAIADPCSGFAGREAFAFGPGQPTIEAALCAAAPVDGFTLGGRRGSTLIVTYAAPFAAPFSVGSAGFAIDADNSNRVRNCGGPDRVITGLSNRNQLPAPLVRYAAGRAVEFDFNGDDKIDRGLAQCLDLPVVPCAARPPTPTPTAGIPPACPQRDLESAETVVRRDGTADQSNLRGGASCGDGGNAAPERSYRYQAPRDGFYTIDTLDTAGLPAPFDTLLYVRRGGDCGGAELACNDSVSSIVPQSRVGLTLRAGEVVAIIVDGSGTQAGDFVLRIARSDASPTPLPTPTPTPDPELPDLVIDEMLAPNRAVVGEPIDVSATVRNAGVSSAGDFEVGFVFARDADLVDGRVEPSARCAVGSLAAGAVRQCALRLQAPVLADGTYFIGAVADVTDEVEERDERNNQRRADSGAIELRGAPTPTVTPTPSVTATGTVTATPPPSSTHSLSPTPTATPTPIGPLVPVGGEIPISAASGSHLNPAVCRDRTGTGIVVWEGPDGARRAIFGRRTSPTGEPIGDAFLVASATATTQRNADVSCVPDGRFTVAWEEPGSSPAIVARRYAPSATPLDEDLLVNFTSSRFLTDPAIATDASGAAVITWAALEGILGRRIDNTGTATGRDFPVNNDTSARPFNPAVSGTADGRFVISWTANDDIFARRFDNLGQPLGNELLVNQFTTSVQRRPAIGSDPAGNFVVVWTSYDQEGPSAGVFGRRFSSTGQALGGEFRVNTTTALEQNFPAVATQSDGSFAVVWSSGSTTTGQDGSEYGVYARRFGPTGQPIGGELQVNTATVGSQRAPAIAADGDGGFVVVWQSNHAGPQYSIVGRQLR